MACSRGPGVACVLRLHIREWYAHWCGSQVRVILIRNDGDEFSGRVFEREPRLIGVYELPKFIDGDGKVILGNCGISLFRLVTEDTPPAPSNMMRDGYRINSVRPDRGGFAE